MLRKESDNFPTRPCPFYVAYLINILAEMVIRETSDGFKVDYKLKGRWLRSDTNFCNADDIILLATSEAELHELVDRLDRVEPKILINVDKTKVMASDG